MKKLSLAVILLFLVATALSAFAAERHITLNSPTIVNGQKLAAGEYVLRYEIKGETADVKLLKNKKEVATLTGHVVETKDVPAYDSLVRATNPDGTATISEIHTANKKQIIKIQAETAVGK